MGVSLLFALGALLALLACAGAARSPAVDALPPADEGVLYAMGYSLGEQLRPYELDEAEAREAASGFLDASSGQPFAGLQHAQLAGQVDLFDERRKKALARREELASAPFLDQAARAEGAVRTESGMIVTVLAPGAGPSPTIFDDVRVNYHGTLRDGTVFHSNRDGGSPEQARLGMFTRCWQESLGAVARGARLRVVCPAQLGFGWGGWPGRVPGGAVLSYDLELLEVIPRPPP